MDDRKYSGDYRMSFTYRENQNTPMTWPQLDGNFRAVEKVQVEVSNQALAASASAETANQASESASLASGQAEDYASLAEEMARISVVRWCGNHEEAPSTRLDGSPLQISDEYGNLTDELRYSWTGTSWVALNSSAQYLEQRLSSSEGAGIVVFDPSASYPSNSIGRSLQDLPEVVVDAADRAEAAADLAATLSGIYADTAAGLAATTSGKVFGVPVANDPTAVILYANVAGAAVPTGARLPSTMKLDQFLLIAAPGYAFCIVDQDGIVAFGVKLDGTVEMSKLLMDSLIVAKLGTPNATLADVTIPGFAFPIFDGDGIVGCGLKDNGAFAVGDLEANTLNGVSVSAILAVIAQGGGGSSAKLLGDFDAEVNHFLSYGQSRSVGVDSLPVITTAQRFDNLKFNGGVRSRDAGGTAASDRSSFQPLVETAVGTTWGETPVAGATDFIKELILAENSISYAQQSYQMLGSAPGQGSTTIANLSAGSAPYQNFKDDITYGFALAQAAGKTYKARAFDWMQGENDYVANTPGATYRSKLIQLRAEFSAHAQATTGQVEEMICIQDQLCDHATYGHANDPYIALIQLDLAKTQPGFYMSCPTYFATPGGVHHTATASKWIGAYHGMVYKRVIVDKLDWKPVSPVSSYRQGNMAIVKLHTPAPPLVFDVAMLAPQTNRGFTLVDATGEAITITSVTIIEKDVVKIVASAPIPAGAKLRYGFGGIGNLRDSQGDTLIFNGGGLNKPMHNWCCIFEETFA